MSGEDVEHVYTLVIVGPADREMIRDMDRALKHSDISWWPEGEKTIRPTKCGLYGHDWEQFYNSCRVCGIDKEGGNE